MFTEKLTENYKLLHTLPPKHMKFLLLTHFISVIHLLQLLLTKVHYIGFSLFILHYIGFEKCIMTYFCCYCVIQNIFTPLKKVPCAPLFALPSESLAIPDLFTASRVLSF